MLREYFSTRDLTFIAMVVAAETAVTAISHLLAIPAVRALGLQMQVASAFFVGIVVAIGLAKVKKIGTLTLIGVGRGVIAGFVTPAVPTLFLALAGGAIFADGVIKLLHGSFSRSIFVVLGIGLYRFGTALIAMYMSLILGFPGAILSTYVIIAVSLLCAVLAAIGGYVGVKVVKELKRAGVME